MTRCAKHLKVAPKLPARESWESIFESNRGCKVIPVAHKMTSALQRSDPRRGPAEPPSGDTMALLKLRAMVPLATSIGWAVRVF